MNPYNSRELKVTLLNSFEPIELKVTLLNSFKPIELKGTQRNLGFFKGSARRNNRREKIHKSKKKYQSLTDFKGEMSYGKRNIKQR